MLLLFKRDHNLAYILILNLLYPAVLGSIFYSVFSNFAVFKIGVIEICCVLMMACVIVFFAIDFLYTYLHEKYSAFHFTSDCLLLLTMQGAFNSINSFAGHVNSRSYCLHMALTFLIFVAWDFLQRKGLGEIFMKIITLEVALALTFTVLSLRETPSYVLPATVSVLGTVLMSKYFLALCRPLRSGQRGTNTTLSALPASVSPTSLSVSGGVGSARPSSTQISVGMISMFIIAILRKINRQDDARKS